VTLYTLEVLNLVVSAVILLVCLANLVLDHRQHGAPRPPHGPIR
jgi:hypothetical protein